MAISSKKFNNKIDYQQRKQNKFQKKNSRTPMTEQKKLRKNKQKERDTKLRGDREWKEQETTPYSRINLRKGKQLYSEFDAKYEHDLQYMGTDEYYELKRNELDWYDYMDYYDQLYQDVEDEQKKIREKEQEQQEQQERYGGSLRKKQQKLSLEKKQSEIRTFGGICSVCHQTCNTN